MRTTEAYDKVLVTLSPEAMSRLVPSLPEEYLHGLRSMKSMGAVVIALALKHQLSEEGYYWYNLPKSAGYPFLALVEHTNYVSPENFGGDHIVYMGDYLEPEHEFFQLSQEELLERFLPALKKFNPKFERDWVTQGLAVPHGLCPAGAAGEPFEEYPGHPDAHRRDLFRLDEPGLSVGPGDEFRRGDREAGGKADDGEQEVKGDIYSIFTVSASSASSSTITMMRMPVRSLIIRRFLKKASTATTAIKIPTSPHVNREEWMILVKSMILPDLSVQFCSGKFTQLRRKCGKNFYHPFILAKVSFPAKWIFQ